MSNEQRIQWIERAIYGAVASAALFVGWQIARHVEDGIRADERAVWAVSQCKRLAGPRLSEWTLLQSDGGEVFLRCKFNRRGL